MKTFKPTGYSKWKCGICDDEFDTKDEAEECCKEVKA